MPKYTTGEMARLCNVTVRTVQYYDSRNLLLPSEFSEGGRRLYSEEDLHKLKAICFLRNIGLPIGSIRELLEEENTEEVLEILLRQQEETLKKEIRKCQEKISVLGIIEKELKSIGDYSVESIGDIAYKMENRKKLHKMRILLVMVGIPMDIVEISTFALGLIKGIWWPFVLGMCLVILAGLWVSLYYSRRVAYICPECHTVFKPGFREVLFAKHTPNLRKLTCTCCAHKGYCIETYDDILNGQGANIHLSVKNTQEKGD